MLRIRARVDTMTKPMEMTAITCDRVWNRILSERFFVVNVNLFFLKQRALGDQKVLLFFILLKKCASFNSSARCSKSLLV